MDSFESNSNSKNSGIRDIPEVGIGLGLAMGHLTGVLEDSNLFSLREQNLAERQPDFPGEYTNRKEIRH